MTGKLLEDTMDIIPDPVTIGPDAQIEPNVFLGYPTGRVIGDRRLLLGRGAHLRTGTVIYGGSIIGDKLQTGHGVVIREENRIGHRCSVWSNSVIDYGCLLGNDVRIHNNVYICQFTRIGDDVFVGPGVTTANDPHPVCTECMKGPVIGNRTRLGANSTILPHVVIGDDSLVGAGAVVTRDVPGKSVVTGNPARVVGRIDELKCQYGHKGMAYPQYMNP